MFTDQTRMRAAFQATGELLSADGQAVSILVVGGAGLNLRGLIARATTDVDVITWVLTQVEGADFPRAVTETADHVARHTR